MADKLRTTFPIAVSFTQGEQPTHTKLNSIASQSKSGLAIVEKAIGDLWNQGGDSLTSAYPLFIANLGRALGSQAQLNSVLPAPDMTGISAVIYTQTISSYVGATEIPLDFAPTAASDTDLATSMTSLGFTTRVNDKSLIDSSVKWAIDTTRNKVFLGTGLTSGTTINYGVSSWGSDSTSAFGFSVIPDQSQIDWKGIKIVSISSNKYYLVLPFRRPSTSTATKYPATSTNQASIASPSVKKYWGPSTTAYSFTSGVSDARLYRYIPSQIVSDIFGSQAAGTTIPAGLLYLYDNTNTAIVDGVTFKIPDVPITLYGVQEPWVLQVEGNGLDSLFTGLTSSASTEAVADYQSRFAIVSVGDSVANAVHKLRQELTGGSYTKGMKNRISHADLVDPQPVKDTNRLPIPFPTPYLAGDDHAFYLSRRGSTSTTSTQRDLFNNAMLGDLLMGSTTSATNYQNTNANSNRIYFSKVDSTSTGTYIYAIPGNGIANPSNASTNALAIRAPTLYLPAYNVIGSASFAAADNTTFVFADDGYDVSGPVISANFRASGDAINLGTFNTSTFTHTKYAELQSAKLELKGADFDISGSTSGGTDTSDVLIGNTNLNTDLYLVNDKLFFGSKSQQNGAANDALVFNDSSNTFAFSADGTIGGVAPFVTTSGVQASRIMAGSLILTNSDTRGIVFSTTSNGLKDDLNLLPDDNLKFDDTTNKFTFSADGSSSSSIVVAGEFDIPSRNLSVTATPYPVFIPTNINASVTFTAPTSNSVSAKWPRLVWVGGSAAFTDNTAIATFPIPYLPPDITVTEVIIDCDTSSVTDGSNSTILLSIANSLSHSGPSILSSVLSGGTVGTALNNKQFDAVGFNFTPGEATSSWYLVMGLQHAGTAANGCTLDIHSIRIIYTQTQL